MNSIVTLASLFALMTLLSASVLYFSFRGKIDSSGKYFLAAEILMLLALIQVITTNIFPETGQPSFFFSGTVLVNASDIAVLISIYSLTYSVKFRTYFLLFLIAVMYCILIEYARIRIDANLPALMTAIPSVIFALATLIVCRNPQDQELKANTFLQWIRYTEIILILIALVRIISYFAGTPVVPRDTSAMVILIYLIFTATCIFRYIAYQSLRISWINTDADRINPLNQNLAKAIQEKNRLLEELISTNRKIGISALASSLAHQLSQPITGLSFQIHNAKHDLLKLQEAQHSLHLLDKAGVELDKLTNLVNGLRRLFEHQKIKLEKIDLIETCDSVIELIAPTLRAHGITLTKKYVSPLALVGNAIQLQQVLINIFNNAIYSIQNAQPDRKEIIIQISKLKNQVIILIMDSGPSIDPNVLPDIFELYKTNKKQGLGVGLWLSKIIIEKHQGSLSVSSNERFGAIFEIQIPLIHKDQIEGNS